MSTELTNPSQRRRESFTKLDKVRGKEKRSGNLVRTYVDGVNDAEPEAKGEFYEARQSER